MNRIYLGTLCRKGFNPTDLYATDKGLVWFNGFSYTPTTVAKVRNCQRAYDFYQAEAPKAVSQGLASRWPTLRAI